DDVPPAALHLDGVDVEREAEQRDRRPFEVAAVTQDALRLPGGVGDGDQVRHGGPAVATSVADAPQALALGDALGLALGLLLALALAPRRVVGARSDAHA